MTVVHNILADNARRQYNIVTDKKKKSTEKLSSGYRINRAADDAAGLAISEKMRAQVRGLNRASKNIQDGIGYVQTGEGALNEVHAILHRIRELSVQASNDTNTDLDRKSIDDEIQELKKETNRIFNDTEFNTIAIFRAPYIPDVEGQPSDYSRFNIGDGMQQGGVLINGKRITWDELGVTESENSDLEKEFTDENGELVRFRLPKGEAKENLRHVYVMDADDTGIKINNLYAGYWDSTITKDGNKYSFNYHGMDISFTAEDGDERSDVIRKLQPDGITENKWEAVPSYLSGYSAVSSTSDSMTLNVTNHNKGDIENWEYSVIADQQGVQLVQSKGIVNDQISHNKINWENFSNQDIGEGAYPIVDWGTSSPNPISHHGNDGGNPITIDNEATYNYSDVINDPKYPDSIKFDFNITIDEAGRDEVAEGLTQKLYGSSVSAPIGSASASATASDGNVYVTAVPNLSFHFQRDQLLRNFGTDGSSESMKGVVTRERVVDGTVTDYELRDKLDQAYLKSTKTTTT